MGSKNELELINNFLDMETKKSVFETLSQINVNDKVEKKNGLTYLSWAWAWAELKKHYPEATYTIYENEQGWNYFTDGHTCWVKTGVTVEGIEHIEYLPVMDFKNKSMAFGSATSFDVNKTIQRSLTKAIARHGLGNYIYAGEDIPEPSSNPVEKVTAKPTELVELSIGTDDWKKVVTYINANKQLGIEAIGKQLTRKYKISASLKKEIAKLISE
jgi:hypothetical protein